MLNVDERVEVAKNVINLAGVQDEDMKQTVYLHALEFLQYKEDMGFKQCKDCGRKKYINCLTEYLMGVIQNEMNTRQKYQESTQLEQGYLDHIDHVILHLIKYL